MSPRTTTLNCEGRVLLGHPRSTHRASRQSATHPTRSQLTRAPTAPPLECNRLCATLAIGNDHCKRAQAGCYPVPVTVAFKLSPLASKEPRTTRRSLASRARSLPSPFPPSPPARCLRGRSWARCPSVRAPAPTLHDQEREAHPTARSAAARSRSQTQRDPSAPGAHPCRRQDRVLSRRLS